jgi:hypothetical protein
MKVPKNKKSIVAGNICIKAEPAVCTPDDAHRCFMNAEMDYLVMGNYLIQRSAQPRQNVPRRILPQAD